MGSASNGIQDGFLSIGETVCAYPMRRIAAVLRFFVGVNDSSFPRVIKCIVLFLSFPVFEVHYSLFKATYFLN